MAACALWGSGAAFSVLVVAAGFVFFLTRTPFSDFLASFLICAAGGLALVDVAVAADEVSIGEGFEAFSRAATALRSPIASDYQATSRNHALPETL